VLLDTIALKAPLPNYHVLEVSIVTGLDFLSLQGIEKQATTALDRRRDRIH
jgi:hypothetical protein